jgi:hypothetical protein
MSKANSVYIIMLATFAAGLWAILSFGSILLRAPSDLAGKWELRAIGTSDDSKPEHQISVQQSGKYFQISIDGSEHSLKMTRDDLIQNGKDQAKIELSGTDLKMTFYGNADSDAYALQTSGALEGNWNARRVSRTYPKRQADQPPTNHAR